MIGTTKAVYSSPLASPLRQLSPLAAATQVDRFIPSSSDGSDNTSAPSRGMGALATFGAVLSLVGCASLPQQSVPLHAAPMAVVKLVNPQNAAATPTSPQPAALAESHAEPDVMGVVEGEPAEPCAPQLCEKVARFDPHIEAAAEKFQVDANLIRGVIAQESHGNPKAGSPKGAKGLMQLMKDTAKDLGVKNRLDPKQSIMGGTHYLSQQLEQNGGDVERALWAYNAGPGNLAKGIKPAETRNYIEAVQEYARQFRDFFK